MASMRPGIFSIRDTNTVSKQRLCAKNLSLLVRSCSSDKSPGLTSTIFESSINAPKAKTPTRTLAGVFWYNSLTITYFHTGCSTIIGAESFHGAVRDGKGWDQLAMVIRHDLLIRCGDRCSGCRNKSNREEVQ